MSRGDGAGGMMLGRYRLVLELGRGGQGAVYLARGEGAAGFARPVVIKRMLAPVARNPEMLKRFAREARITAQLRHPSIVSVIDFAREGESYVMVLEYVHGYDLRRWERFVHQVHGRFAPELVAYPMLRVMEALHYAHTLRGADGGVRRVIHRDVSLANVLIDVEGHVKLTDFGIASMADEEMTADTTTVRLKGKLPYLAPEMYMGAPPSEQTDLYACGVVLHELLTGRNEFHAATAVETMARATSHVPTRVDAVRPDIPKDLADLVARALAKEPGDRFQTAQELSRALRGVFGHDDDLLAEGFRKAVGADFNDPRFAQVTCSPSLGKVEALWRRTPADRSLIEHARAGARSGVGADNALTVDELGLSDLVSPLPPPAATDPQRPSARLRGRGAALGVAAVLGAATVAYVWAQRAASTPQFVYVDRQTVAHAVPAQDARHSGAASAPRTPAPAAAPPATAAARSPAPTTPEAHADRLTRAFARRRPAVERCFASHRRNTEEHDLLHVQFVIDRRGRVQSAALVPDGLTSTPFGRCVIRIASQTRFGPQPEPLAFRIPIRARRSAR